MLTAMVNIRFTIFGLKICEINGQTVSTRKFKYRLKSKSSVYGKLYIPVVIWIKEAEMRPCYCQS